MKQMILSYNFPARHLAKLRMAAMKLGVPVRPVEPHEYLQTLSALTGTSEGFESFYDGDHFSQPMLVLCGFSDAMVQTFLQLCKASRLPPVARKAVLTETNKNWNSLELYDELTKEHEAMRAGQSAHEPGAQG